MSDMSKFEFVNSRGQVVRGIDELGEMVSVYTVNHPGAPEPEYHLQGTLFWGEGLALAKSFDREGSDVTVTPPWFFNQNEVTLDDLKAVCNLDTPYGHSLKVGDWGIKLSSSYGAMDGNSSGPRWVKFRAAIRRRSGMVVWVVGVIAESGHSFWIDEDKSAEEVTAGELEALKALFPIR